MNGFTTSGGGAVRSLLTFRVADEWYAVDAARVQRVEFRGPVTPVPGAPPAIAGVFPSRGELVAALDPRPLLGLPAAAEPPGMAVIVRDGELSAGILADWVDQVTTVPGGAVEPPAAGLGAPYAAGQTRLEGRLVCLLNLGALFSAVAGE